MICARGMPMRLLAMLACAFVLFVGAREVRAERNPGFSCSGPLDPAAQTICGDDELSSTSFRVTQAYYALRGATDRSQWQSLKQTAIEFLKSTLRNCELPARGSVPTEKISTVKACLLRDAGVQRRYWIGELQKTGNNDALSEAERDPAEHLRLQQSLKEAGFLPQEAEIDGVYGEGTRDAIRKLQAANGVAANGFLSPTLVASLRSKYGMTPVAVSGTSILTSGGVLVAGISTGPACGQWLSPCKTISFNGKILLAGEIAGLEWAYPSLSDPKLVAVFAGNGGNAADPSTRLIDLSTPSPVVVEKPLSWEPRATPADNGVFIEQINGKDQIGDNISEQYYYKYRSGNLVLTHKKIVYSNKKITDTIYSFEVMENPTLRAPLLLLIGQNEFSKFRYNMSVTSKDELNFIGGRYIVGEGCTPHQCNSSGGIFVIDVLRQVAWAAETTQIWQQSFPSKTVTKVWGNLNSEEFAIKTIGNWLSRKSISWNQVSFVSKPSEKVGNISSTDPNFSGVNIGRQQIDPLNSNASADAPRAVGIHLIREGGTFKVPVRINGVLDLHFTVDSGASDVNVPADVVLTLVRTGTIKDNDFIGEKTYVLADGSTVRSNTFLIRQIQVGDKTVTNVVGSVADIKGSLLLGQSFLSRFRKVSFDYEDGLLILE